jgi:hypothetical protein
MSVRLNIGSGATRIKGFTPVDHILGTEAFPLKYEDDSVDEIRAVHVLEHFGHDVVNHVLDDWVRVLKPGGRIRIAVPDMNKIADMIRDGVDEAWQQYAMGGQSSDDDFHKSAFTRDTLSSAMLTAGIGNIESWQSGNVDCASHPVSLNLQGIKGGPETVTREVQLKVSALMSVPRVGWTDAYSSIFDSLRVHQIPLQQFNGVYWGQCMQRGLEDAIEHDVDWVLTIDFDSMFTHKDVATLLQTMAKNTDIDAICALQCRRGIDEYPLLTVPDMKEKGEVAVAGPFQVATAHFGLTAINLDALKEVPKPWFCTKANDNGEYGEGRLDDDIWFWHQWKEAGKTVYVHPDCRIGHLQLMVSQINDEGKPEHIHVKEWHERKET